MKTNLPDKVLVYFRHGMSDSDWIEKLKAYRMQGYKATYNKVIPGMDGYYLPMTRETEERSER